VKITPATTLVLQALAHDARHGFDIIDKTTLPSGTVYPILRRLEREGCASAHWEEVATAQDEQRPPRRYYQLTAAGKALLTKALAKYRVSLTVTTRNRRLRPA
jgi:PadR family transcriptional regulator, regulatory protein PadR